MKKSKFIVSAFALSAILTACAGGEQERAVEIDSPKEVKQEKKKTPEYADASFEDGMLESAFQYYLKMERALVQSDAEAANDAAANLAEDLTEKHPNLKDIAQRMADSKDLEVQRQQFEKLTLALEPMLRNSIKSGVIYKQYCPMAFNNKGAFWLSETKEINNPYFGDKMLHCGSTKDSIKKK